MPVKPDHRNFLSGLSLRKYLTVFIVVIVIVLAGFLTTVSYLNNREGILAQNQDLREYGEINALESVRLVDTGLRLYDNTLNDQMKDAFPSFVEAYNESRADVSRINLSNLRSGMQPAFKGNLDLYIINESGVIVGSTVTEVMGVDFSQWPEYYRSITDLRTGDSFGADRVVRSLKSASEESVTGDLRKFAYMPTPDHRFLLEMGLESNASFAERNDLSYAGIAKRLKELNPNLVSVRIVDTNFVLVSDSANTTEIHDPGIDRALGNRESYTASDPENGLSTTYLFANLRDPAVASDMSLVVELVYSDALLESSLQRILMLHLIVAVLAVLMGIVLAYGTARFLTRPIEEIMQDVGTIAGGDLEHPIREIQIPEFARLKESITTMISRIRHYSEELEKGRAELAVASQIQLSFLPRNIPDIPGFDIAAVSIPAKEVGGDFYDIIDMGPGKTGLVIADVSGKGVPAALFMVLSRTTVRASTMKPGTVAAEIADANRMIAQDAEMGMFVTLVFGILEQSGRFPYANAGHNPPYHYHASTGEISRLCPGGMALGVLEDAVYQEGEVDLVKGDMLVFYTDGVTEAENLDHAQFGEENLKQIIRTNHECTASDLIAVVREEILTFTDGASQFDDITLLVVRKE